MRRVVCVCGLVIFPLLPSTARAEVPGSLLRNSSLQDDWATHLPETKNHHWSYSSEYQNRRDYNPDGWWLKGSWEWLNADAAPECFELAKRRKLILRGPEASVAQRVNWVLVHDDRRLEGFPDAGGFPHVAPVRSRRPLAVVRDLSLYVAYGGEVPENAAVAELALCPPAGMSVSDPYGTHAPPTVSVSAPLQAVSSGSTILTLRLPASQWLEAALKNPKEKEEAERSGVLLPATVSVAIRFKSPTGHIELQRVELSDAPPASPNLLANGGFEELDRSVWPAGWGRPEPYAYFPPGRYYMFNTWHNHSFENRGPVVPDSLAARSGAHSMKMIVAAGDQKAVASQPIVLNQAEPRLIEVGAWVKTDHLNFLQIDAVDEKGRRLDGFNFIHKAPISFGTDDWRRIRQVFRPREPVQSFRLLLAARGVNGYTLDDTGSQPQANVVGTLWWDDVRVFEPESSAAELRARGVRPPSEREGSAGPQLSCLELGEQLLGENQMRFTIAGRGSRTLTPQLELISPSGTKSLFKGATERGRATAWNAIRYTLPEPCPTAYTEYRGKLSLLDARERAVASTELWLGTWTTPIDLELGALYLLPDQKQFVRMNLGLAAASMARVGAVRLDLLRRGTGEVLKSFTVPATPAAIAAQRERIPVDLRDDFTNLLLTDLDIFSLPLQPFSDPQRNWLIRATILDADGKPLEGFGPVVSQPFCRLNHEPPQPPIASAAVKGSLFYINGQPWMPWGVVYGHIPVYDGPADPGSGKYRDLRNLAGWSYYDRFGSASYTRLRNDFNCLRYVAGYSKATDPQLPTKLEKPWKEDNLYCSSFFIVPNPVWSVEELIAKAGGKEKLDEFAAFAKSAPMVASLCLGVEEAFGLFHAASPEQLKGMAEAVELLRKATGKPLMVSHGGAWNLFEFEKVPFYDIYDPETEPLYPAALHVDLAPIVRGKDKAVWLRPQMYESVPYERWRYHTYVELMRGCTGWQTAHGPGDQSLFRGLHAEMEFMKPIIYSGIPLSPGERVRVRVPSPANEGEHPHPGPLPEGEGVEVNFGIPLSPGERVRVRVPSPANEGEHPHPGPLPKGEGVEVNFGIPLSPGERVRVRVPSPANEGEHPHPGPLPKGEGAEVEGEGAAVRVEPWLEHWSRRYGGKTYIVAATTHPLTLSGGPFSHLHGIQYMPNPIALPAGARLTQLVKLDPKAPPDNLVLFVKTQGRWNGAAAWGKFDIAPLRSDPKLASAFLHAFYRNWAGFIGWDEKLLGKALPYIPDQAAAMGPLPAAGNWVKLDVPLETLAPVGAVLDGVACANQGGGVQWGQTAISLPDGQEQVLIGDSLVLPPEQLAKVKLSVPGLKPGTKVRVVFEDRELVASDGFFTDDFRGADLYQRHGGRDGYGIGPVALHVYEVP